MIPSNTMVPPYYAAFRDSVIRGEYPVCNNISLEMCRIDNLIASPSVYYDPDPVEGFIDFCESELTLPDGQQMYMLDSFKLWAEQLRGWYTYVTRTVPMKNPNGSGVIYVTKRLRKRLTNRQFIVAGRGSAKTVYLTDNQGYELIINPKTTNQLMIGPIIRQAEEVLTRLNTSIARGNGLLLRFMAEGSLQNTTGSRVNRPKLALTKKGMQNFMTNSLLEVRALSIENCQGYSGQFATVDEWRSCDIREDVTEALVQGLSKNEDWWLIETSSEGTIRNAVGDSIGIELQKILHGDIKDPSTSIWWYRLDNVQEVNDPNMWIKANPNIGKTVMYDIYQRDKETAENNPEKANDILAKRFGIPVEGFTYFFPYEETLATGQNLSFWQMQCAMGLDLSLGDDFCAATFLFPMKNNDYYGVKTLCFISSATFSKLPLGMVGKYQTFIDEGSLIVLEGITIDMLEVYDVLNQYIEDNQYEVMTVGYDPYNAKAFIERWQTEYGEYGIEKVIQGKRTESVPLGEIKKLTENRRILFDQQLMTFALGNCVVNVDNNGNRMLTKKRADQKIDAVAAMMDAYIAYKLHKDDFG